MGRDLLRALLRIETRENGSNLAYEAYKKMEKDYAKAVNVLGRRQDALDAWRKSVADEPETSPAKGLHQLMLRHREGALSEEELLRAAGKLRVRQSYCHFGIGLNRLSDGDRKGAICHFRQSVATGAFLFTSYGWSLSFLARLEQDRNWPPGIPVRK